jgi:hypothetical protein
MGVVYSALKEKDEIRLLQLEPGSGSDPIKCSLIHARLGESPTYNALSYMWGEERATRSYMLQVEGGRALGVRENLGNALRYMRLKDEVRVLWVDAVCINQADDGERGHQVAQMGMIYSQATTVRVWLGLPDDFTTPAFRFLSNSSTVQQTKLGVTDLSDWKAVAQLCRKEYWDRLWIIQEVVLAARIDIHCGERILEWDQFSKVLFAFEEDIHTFDIPTNRRLRTTIAFNVLASIVDSAAMKICRQRRTNTNSGPVTELSSLLSLLWIHKDAKCVDVRDKIFGLHSFAPACCRRSIPVDYTCSAFTLCRRLLGHGINCHPHGSQEEGAFRRSLELHELIIGGALKQRGSTNPFQIGCPTPQDLHPLDQGETADSRAASPFKVLGR